MHADLQPDTIISHYRILSRLGAGGMGDVYLAQDTALERKVAIKVLTLDATDDLQARTRLIREAQAAGQLDHPNICATYEVGEADGTGFIVMQYIEGETLAARVRRAPMPLGDALDIAVQVSDALAEAHSRGIVHRDIKPQNIMISARGQAKVLDFGLAKNAPPTNLSASHVVTESLVTTPGTIVGTLPYMSPEQVKGEPVDARSDVFSFGTMLYELVSGRQPFANDTAAATMASILTTDPPPLARYAREVPLELERITAKALAKDKDDRYQSAKDLFIDLRTLHRQHEREVEERRAVSNRSAVGGVGRPSRAHGASIAVNRHRMRLVIGLSTSVIAVAGVVWYLTVGGRPSPSPFQNMTIARLTSSGKAVEAAISPDGKYVAYVLSDAGRQSLWLRQATTTSNVQIVAPSQGHSYRGLAFAGDGVYLYFLKREKSEPRAALYQIPVLGGDARKVMTDVSIQDTDSNFSFSPNGRQLALIRLDASFNRTLVIANVDGTGDRTLASRAMPAHLAGVAWSPDGKIIACLEGSFAASAGPAGAKTFLAVRVEDGVTKPLSPRRWSRVGSFAWLSDSSGLIIAAVDKSGPSQLWHLSSANGEARRVTNDLNNYQTVSLTANSKALVTSQTDSALHIWVAPGGDASRARKITSESGDYRELSWTPDGRIVYQSAASGRSDIWIMNGDGTGRKQLTSDLGTNFFPSVSPDGRYIVFDSDRAGSAVGLWRMDTNGNDPRLLAASGGAASVSADSRWVIYYIHSPTGVHLWKVSIDGGSPVQLTFENQPARSVVSPDGKYIASNYMVTGPSSQFRIAVLPYDGKLPERIFEIPTSPVRELRWTPDGKAIALVATRNGVSNVWAQPIDGGPANQLTDFKSESILSFNWSRDGKQLACSRGPQTSDVVLISDFK